ncbi:hypothetical protein, partial [Aliarcobacter butzleri]|uniref:hypothetical protein n=1 Tax=Aliarcobacter butzleri TaxID=28197 RepID=UPI003AF908D3
KSGSLDYMASTDKVKRVGSFIVMDNYPFHVQVALSEEDYLARWERNLLTVTILFVLFDSASIFGFIIVKKSYKKEQSAI